MKLFLSILTLVAVSSSADATVICGLNVDETKTEATGYPETGLRGKVDCLEPYHRAAIWAVGGSHNVVVCEEPKNGVFVIALPRVAQVTDQQGRIVPSRLYKFPPYNIDSCR